MEVQELKKAIRKQSRTLRKAMLTFTKELIRVRTENPPGLCYEECVRLIAENSAGTDEELKTTLRAFEKCVGMMQEQS